MNNVFRRIVILFTAIIVSIAAVSTVYLSNLFKEQRVIEDVDHLSGQRIGVISAYEGDYLLSDRKDLTLLRYDTEADLLVALCYRQVDAAALTDDMARYVLRNASGFKINETPIASNGLASLFVEGSEYMQEFADFLEVFKKSGRYEEYVNKVNNDEYYDGSPLPEETGTGKVLRIGYLPDYMPTVFKDAKTNHANGSEVEIYIEFANYMNYQIEWFAESETTAVTDIAYKKIDICLAGYSEIYRAECDDSPYSDLGPTYMESSIVLLEVEDYEQLSLGAIAKEE